MFMFFLEILQNVFSSPMHLNGRQKASKYMPFLFWDDLQIAMLSLGSGAQFNTEQYTRTQSGNSTTEMT